MPIASKEMLGEGRIFIFFLYTLIAIPLATKFIITDEWPHDQWLILEVSVITLFVALLVRYIHKKHQRVIILSETDALTGLYNRHKLSNDLNMEITKAHRTGTSLVIAYADVDRFKRINDEFGHDTGDKVLKDVADFLKSSMRQHFDTCYRIGGDEFVILMPLVDGDKIKDLHTRIIKIEKYAMLELSRYGASLSIGMVKLNPNETPKQFVKRADQEMYKQKKINKRKMKAR